jgi:hypothetical protein
MSSSPRDINLEEIQTYDSALMTHDFIPTTRDAPYVAKNLGAEPIINENEEAPLENVQVGLEENEAPPANDHEEKPQQENDNEPHPMRRSRCERRSVIPNDCRIHERGCK